MTPALSVGVSNTSGHLGYSVPPWLQGENWSQGYGNIQAHPNQLILDSPHTWVRRQTQQFWATQEMEAIKHRGGMN